MADWQKQYRTITTAETAAQESLSLRQLRHAEWSINSTIVAMSPKLVSDASPSLVSADSSTAETVLRVYGPFFVASTYDAITATIGHYRSTGAGTITWKLYCSAAIYNGSPTLDTSSLSNGYTSATIATTSSDTHAIAVSKRAIALVRGVGDQVWFVLSATNSVDTTRARMVTLDITAQRRGAYS